MEDVLNERPDAAIDPVASTALDLARLYHFLELSLAHPGEDGYEYFRSEVTEAEFLAVYLKCMRDAGALRQMGASAAGRFFSSFRQKSYEEIEAAHIAIFTNNFPHLPCPPYGSVFLAVDSEKRLEEMLAIKEFYQRSGVDISDTFNDLPDHLCVELEFLHLLCFREDAAAASGDEALVEGIRRTEAEFLDRFLLPFVTRLADIAVGTVAQNPYSNLLDTTRFLLTGHRRSLGDPVVSPAQTRENQS